MNKYTLHIITILICLIISGSGNANNQPATPPPVPATPCNTAFDHVPDPNPTFAQTALFVNGDPDDGINGVFQRPFFPGSPEEQAAINGFGGYISGDNFSNYYGPDGTPIGSIGPLAGPDPAINDFGTDVAFQLGNAFGLVANAITNALNTTGKQVRDLNFTIICYSPCDLGTLGNVLNINTAVVDPITGEYQGIPQETDLLIEWDMGDNFGNLWTRELGKILAESIVPHVTQEVQDQVDNQLAACGLDGSDQSLDGLPTTGLTANTGPATAALQAWQEAFQQMTAEIHTNMIAQTEAIGMFFDAKHQLETQRIFQKRAARAHKDYHVSEQMCEMGTFTRDLANSDRRSDLSAMTLSNQMLARGLGTGGPKTLTGPESDELSRLNAYIDTYCNIRDNAGQNDHLCATSKGAARQNKDVNFTQTIDLPLTLSVDFMAGGTPADEQNVFAFLDNLFLNDVFPFDAENKSTLAKYIIPLQDKRSIIAMRSVAQSTFAHIIAQKSQGGPHTRSATPYLYSLIHQMGTPGTMTLAVIEDYLGSRPSYFAQMEVLTKKIYQDPEFIANLYDKPANVKRIRTAMTAIKLMQDRDINEALMRREMLFSMILELQLREQQVDVHNSFNTFFFQSPQ